MKMSIARALKERKRIIGEMNTLRCRINGNNVIQLTVRAVDSQYAKPTAEEFAKKRHADPVKCMEDWYRLREKLIALKTALHAANSGAIEKLARLGELKAELQLVSEMPGYSNDENFAGENSVRITDVIYDTEWIATRQDELRRGINEAQDAIDEYNATHYVEIPD